MTSYYLRNDIPEGFPDNVHITVNVGSNNLDLSLQLWIIEYFCEKEEIVQ